MFKQDNVVTKSVPNSGKWSLMSMVSTRQEPTMETQIFNLKELTSTSMRLQEEDTFQEPSLWILSQEQWTQWEQDHLVNSSDQITLFSVKLEPVTTGLKDTTPKELNWLIQYSMSLEKKLKDATAFKVSKSPTPSEVELDLEWELYWSQRSERNILIESWKPFQLSHPLKSQTLSLSPTTPPCLFINWLKMPMNAW